MVKGKFEAQNRLVSDLLRDQYGYSVPEYQRDYSWDKDEVEALWQDIMTSFNEKSESYFLGSMVLQDLEGKYIVIDGQQRLATITMFLAAIRDLLYEIGEQGEAYKINRNYILIELEKDSHTRKLTLNLRNKEFFYDCIQLAPDNEKRKDFFEFKNLEKTNRLIKNAYQLLKKKLKEEIDGKDNSKIKNYLCDLAIHIRKTLRVITIIVYTEEEAYLIFETINYRGLELSVADLFKNYLIRKARTNEDKKDIVRLWNDIARLLDDKIRHFLRHFWLSKHELINERNLFGKLKKHVEDNDVNVLDLVKELKDEATVYSALQNSEDELWKNDKEVTELVKDFNVLNAKMCIPVLMSGQKMFTPKEFNKLLRVITNFTFRYSTICNYHNNVLIRKYSNTAIKIRKAKIKSVQEVLGTLKEIYPDEEAFIAAFSDKAFNNYKLARYILKMIDLNQSNYPEPKDYDQLTLEHILPKIPSKEWVQYLSKREVKKEDIYGWIHRIGNFTLLEMTMNNKAKNSLFIKKRDNHYKKSELWLNKQIVNETEWDDKVITSRQVELAEIAEKVWKVHFPKPTTKP